MTHLSSPPPSLTHAPPVNDTHLILLLLGSFPKGLAEVTNFSFCSSMSIIRVSGQDGLGKTILALNVIKEAQKLGGYCAYLDMENALDPLLLETSVAVDVIVIDNVATHLTT
ncbi:unnamed protein product [Lactuca saligna]|uniref:RecA-like N-terminal domain-containing protein n=1 Tax=Lactuca saligna TaxID=75948 RepID=A0AA36EB53_LACSI|nr:unnamed protein product [Lactuca saligna]